MYTVHKCGEQATAMTIPESDFFFSFPCSEAEGLYFSSDTHLAPAEKTTLYGSLECISIVVILIISNI